VIDPLAFGKCRVQTWCTNAASHGGQSSNGSTGTAYQNQDQNDNDGRSQEEQERVFYRISEYDRLLLLSDYFTDLFIQLVSAVCFLSVGYQFFTGIEKVDDLVTGSIG
jgi:hypothetical protein